ncbi:MAG: hypothetical protein JXA23_11980 [Bacteroidales bacterium]|nr:hypothetical protein [Bacteroidales bacterium]
MKVNTLYYKITRNLEKLKDLPLLFIRITLAGENTNYYFYRGYFPDRYSLP